MLESLHFIRPLWLLALVPCGLLLWWFARRHRNGGQWTRYVEPQLWQHVLTGFSATRSPRGLTALAVAGSLLILALAGPTWQRLPQPVFKTQSALVIALDLSKSMDAEDVKPSRLNRARLKIRDILNRRREGETALVVYAAEAFTVIPLTDDVNTIRAQLEPLSTELMPAQGSRADRALDQAVKLLKQGGVAHGHVLLITDGVDAGSFEAARNRLRSAGHQLSILGVGTSEGSPIPQSDGGFVRDRSGAIVLAKLEEAELRALAPFRRLAIDDSDIDYLLPDTNPGLFEKNAQSRTALKTDSWQDEGYWLLLPVLALASLVFRRGLLLGLCLLLPLVQPQSAHAMDWQSLWRNDNQRGQQAYESKDYDAASTLFQDPQWRASAAYRRGDFEAAAKALEGIDSADAWYNRGNALAKLGRTQQAIDAYDHALKLEPEHEDAQYNRELLKRQQEQQQKQQENQESPQQDQSGDQKKSDQGDSQPGDQGKSEQSESGDPQSSQQASTGEQERDESDQQQSASSDEADKPQQSQQAAQEANGAQGESGAEEKQAPQAGELAQSADDDVDEDEREQQQMDRLLQRVPDDPGGLLRRKFLYQYRQRQQDEEQNPW